MNLRDLLQKARVLPVLQILDAEQAVPLARALAEGGLNVLEVTLRSDAALEAIRRIDAEVSEVVVGAGTVTRPQDFDNIRQAGARFAVSPGLTPELAAAGRDADLPFLPGIMTPSEALVARQRGFDTLKLFPATTAGGIDLLRSIGGPLPELAFCPTGGLNAASFRDYLALPNVLCVGGSWVAPRSAVEAADWPTITRLAREACS
ncbi:MAG: bifunctional 4-hydroxy-2-oxoglutarate aldolase/2-dehydro-3-deoxy-phosphogluconate aldolase [Acidobacteriota bacterium]